METITRIRPDLEPLPIRMRGLAIDDRGYPVPWFVAWHDGKPEFRAADASKLRLAIRDRLCWVCGHSLGVHMTFVIGPMCGINRTSAEPPSHLECARWSARNCPFLSNAARKRREDEVVNIENFQRDSAGLAIARNPGVTLLWTTKGYRPFGDGAGKILIRIGEPESIEFFKDGRQATRAEIDESVRTGLPILADAAKSEGEDAEAELERYIARFNSLLPAEKKP